MKKLKMAIVIGCSVITFSGTILGVQAHPASTKSVIQSTQYAAPSPENTERAIDLITYYRTYNGYLQYRRWDAASGTWYDPYWITIGPIE